MSPATMAIEVRRPRYVRLTAALASCVLALLILASGAQGAAGELSPQGCIADTGDAAGCGSTQQGLDGASSVAASPDGKSVYVVSSYDNAITRFDRNTTTGALTGAGCIADTGDTAGCGTTQQGLNGARSVAVSPDGKSVYVASLIDDAIVRFDRNTTTGALTGAGCIADTGDTAGCGTTQQGLDGASGVAVSPDGKSVYVASFTDDAITRFDRNTTTGALTGAGCIADTGDAAGCGSTQQGLNGASSVAVSPDRKSVYVVSEADSAITRFDRNTTTGALTVAGCIADTNDIAGCGTTQQGLNGASSVAVSPDGKSVYVASFTDDAITRFDRNTTTGALTGAGCIADTGDAAGCGTTQQGLNGASSVAVSPDGKSVYVASFTDDAITRFDRNTTTGALTGAGCIADTGDTAGCGSTQQGLNVARGVAVSPDGKSAYVVSEADNAITRFDREPAPLTNSSPITIPAILDGIGASNPFPSQITVSGEDIRLSDVNVTLHGLSHAWLDDIDVILIGPTGASTILTSDVGGANAAAAVDLTFDDDASGQLADAGPISSGSYRPSNFEAGEDFDPPAGCNPGPGGNAPQSNCLAEAFNGTDPNGTWSLYVADDDPAGNGTIAYGWSLQLETDIVYPNVSIDSGPMSWDSGPPGLTADSTPTFGFSVDDPTATVECSIYEQGGGPVAYEPCSGPGDTHTPASPLADGDYTFAVRATDAATNSSGYLNDFTVDTTSLANFGEITVPNEGAATPFPSPIQVSGLDTKISDVNVTLHGLNHGSADDLEVVVVGPTEAAVYLLSDAGGATPVSYTDPTFDDQAAEQLLDESGGIPTGSHRPTNQTGVQLIEGIPICNPGPDPGIVGADPPQSNCLAQAFNGTDPNGQWALYVADDTANGHSGRIASGWSLEIETDVVSPTATIDSGPSGPITDTTPTFGFSADEDVSFACRIRAQTGPALFAPCSGPGDSHTPTSPLADGDYTFDLRATDAAGNQGLDSVDFTVDTPPPDTTIDSGPTGTITFDEATFTFSGDPNVDIAGLECRIDSGLSPTAPARRPSPASAMAPTQPSSEPKTQPETRTRHRPPAPSQSTQPPPSPRSTPVPPAPSPPTKPPSLSPRARPARASSAGSTAVASVHAARRSPTRA